VKQDIVHVPTEGHRLPDAGIGVGADVVSLVGGVQFFSSELSRQLLRPSHLHEAGMH